MKFDVEKMQAMAQPRSERAIKNAKARKENRDWLRMSQEIALYVHSQIKTLGITQRELAKRLDVSPAYVTRLLKGEENLTLESIGNLQDALGNSFLYIRQPSDSMAVMA